MKQFTLLFLLLVVFFACSDDDSFKIYESVSNGNPIFVGNDSILYIESYTKMEETGSFYRSELETTERDVRFKLIDTNGQEISTIWQLNSTDNSIGDLGSCLAMSYSNASKTLMISYTSPNIESYDFKLMVMDLQGNVIKNFTDNDLAYASTHYWSNFPVAPNGAYYVLYNEIKNTAGEVVKTLADTVMDWNAKGLLVRSQSIDSTRIEIEGNEYDVFSHPDARIWYGTNRQYLASDQDTIKICRWPDSSVLKKLVVDAYSSYTPYVYGYSNYDMYYFNCSSLSPDLKYMVNAAGGISLVDMDTGELIQLISPVYTYDSE